MTRRPTRCWQSGDAGGVFQLEGQGMRDMLRKMRPDRFEDLIAAVALYRPGPMANIPDYCRRKHGGNIGRSASRTSHAILAETYGIIVYQEQVMQIAQMLAGYSLGGADLLRRAMGKKIPAEMEAQRDIFTEGAIERGIEPEKAKEVFDLMAKFAGYGFNKSPCRAVRAARLSDRLAEGEPPRGVHRRLDESRSRQHRQAGGAARGGRHAPASACCRPTSTARARISPSNAARTAAWRSVMRWPR